MYTLKKLQKAGKEITDIRDDMLFDEDIDVAAYPELELEMLQLWALTEILGRKYAILALRLERELTNERNTQHISISPDSDTSSHNGHD